MLSIFSQITVVNDTFSNGKLSQHPHGKISKSLSDYIYCISARGLLFGCTDTQSTQCSCVAGGTDEVAGWRWGFPVLAWAWPWHSNGCTLYWGTRGQSVCLPHSRISTVPPSWAIFLLTRNKTTTPLSRHAHSFHLTPFWWLPSATVVWTEISEQFDGLQKAFCTDINGPQRMQLTDFGDPLTFLTMPLRGWYF